MWGSYGDNGKEHGNYLLRFRIWGFGIGVYSFGFRHCSSGSRVGVWGLGFRDWGLMVAW